jgi:nicotinic acid mononucleotide adenylyltransferase
MSAGQRWQREPAGSISEERFSIERARRFRDSLQRCSPAGAACLELFLAERLAGEGTVAVLAGSFNPLTRAHTGLASAAEAAGLGPVVFTLSTRTVDKERPVGAMLEDRLLVLEAHAERTPPRAFALINRGLYVDQAELFRARLPWLERLIFLVGFDKIVQIFDPRYYEDRERALERLFERASFAVAPRGQAGPAELEVLLERPENRRFAAGVRLLPTGAELAEVSSSAARDELAAGELPGFLAEESLAFCRATGCHLRPQPGADGRLIDRYAERRRALESG